MIFNLSALILFFFKILKNPGGGTRYPTNQISLALEPLTTFLKYSGIGPAKWKVLVPLYLS